MHLPKLGLIKNGVDECKKRLELFWKNKLEDWITCDGTSMLPRQ
jgi:hypothetical protein